MALGFCNCPHSHCKKAATPSKAVPVILAQAWAQGAGVLKIDYMVNPWVNRKAHIHTKVCVISFLWLRLYIGILARYRSTHQSQPSRTLRHSCTSALRRRAGLLALAPLHEGQVVAAGRDNACVVVAAALATATVAAALATATVVRPLAIERGRRMRGKRLAVGLARLGGVTRGADAGVTEEGELTEVVAGDEEAAIVGSVDRVYPRAVGAVPEDALAVVAERDTR